MKSTDVIQPAPLASAIAANGSKDSIPQLQQDAPDAWYCSIENGFPDITMQKMNEGGFPPRGQGANGLFYITSDQKVYLQNGGYITFDEDVSDAIGGYPKGAVLDYVHDDSFDKVISLIDDNTYNFVDNPTYIDDTHWQKLSLASVDNAKFQCAPFSINAGTLSNGNNNTLAYSGSTITCDPCTITTADSRTRDFDSSTTYDASGLANGRYQIYKKYSNGDLFLDKNLSVFSTIPANCTGSVIVRTNDGILSNFSDSNYCVLPQKFNVSGGKTFKISFEVTTGNDVATQQYFIGAANISVSSDPVIIGLYNGKFVAYVSYSSSDSATAITSNITPVANTTYQVEFEFTGTKYNLYVNGTLASSINSTSSLWTADMAIGVQCGSQGTPSTPWLGTVNLLNSKIEIDGSVWWTGVYKYWLDNSETSLNLKVLDENNTYQINNDLVYIGDCTVSGGVVTDILNADFNATREGKWVFNVATLNTSTSAGVYKVDLSSVIPNDSYNYQLLCRYFIERSGVDNTNSNYYIRTNLRGNTFLSYTTITSDGIDGGTTSNDVTQQGGQFNAIIDGTRNLYVTINGTNLYDNSVYLVGYRRLSAL